MSCRSVWSLLKLKFRNALNAVSFLGSAALSGGVPLAAEQNSQAHKDLNKLVDTCLEMYLVSKDHMPDQEEKVALTLRQYGKMNSHLFDEVQKAIQSKRLTEQQTADCLRLVRDTYRQYGATTISDADQMPKKVRNERDLLAAAVYAPEDRTAHYSRQYMQHGSFSPA